MKLKPDILFCCLLVFICGCKTLPAERSSVSKRQTLKETKKAVNTIAGALTGKELSEEEIKKLQKQIRKDPEAQSAIQSIGNAMNEKEIKVKYCPVTGKRYAFRLTLCPEHQVELKVVGQ